MAATSPSAFVGRAAELARLVAALDDAGQGRAPAIVIEGESGAGKTRLLREFAALAAGRGDTVLFGRCVDCGEAGPPYWPFVDALRSLRAGRDHEDWSDADRAGYFEEVLDRLEEAGRHSPVVLLIDDLHWADRSTRDLLGFLLANLAGGPGPLVVVTVRSEALVRGHPLVPLLAELRRSRRAEFLRLGRFRKGDVAAQLESLLGATPEPDLLEEIWRRSEGNPFFVEELLAADRGSERLTPPLPGGHPPSLGGPALTSTLQPILAARLEALSPEARAAASAIAASVGPVGHRILAEVAGLPEAALLDGLRECADHHVLVADSKARTYAFRHSLLQEAAYASLLPGEAARLHAAYGRALSAALPGPSDPRTGALPGSASAVADLSAVAWHLYAAGDAEQGLPAALAAAVAADSAGGYAEAHQQYERALELAGRLPAEALEAAFLRATPPPSGTPVQTGGGDGRSGAEAAFLKATQPPSGTPVQTGGGDGRSGAEAAFLKATQPLSGTPVQTGASEGQSGVEPAFLTAAGDRSGTPVESGGRFDRVHLTDLAAEAALSAGEPQRAVELLQEALAGADAGDASRLYLGLGRARWAAGDSGGALEAYDEAVRRLADPETAEGVRAVAAAAEARMLAGRYGESRQMAEEGLALARRLGLPLEEAEILGTLGVDLAFLGDAEPAAAALDEAVAVAEKAGRPRPLARAWLNRAEVLSGPLNRLDEAAEAAAAGVDRLRSLGLGRSDAAALAAVLANTLFRAGRWHEADPVIDAALADRPTGAAAIELLLARARLAVGRGRFEAAHADLERVDHRWTQAVAPRYRAPLLTLEAGLALWEGRTADAREAVARALELVAGSDEVWLVAAVVWHGLRAEGDRAERARALGDRAEAQTAAEAAGALVERASALQQGAAPAVRPVVAAYEALCRAEARRAGAAAGANDRAGANDVRTDLGEADAWAEAAERWAELRQPYPAAYARFREAEAVLSGQARSARAGTALRAAHEVAVRLGAEPFRLEIEALAGRARLPLAASAGEASAGGRADGAATRDVNHAKGGKEPGVPGPLAALTARELDVLRLLVEGRTNRQIAAALFISAKTASVHVSHILAKLGVRSRVQAVAVAHQVGVAGGR